MNLGENCSLVEDVTRERPILEQWLHLVNWIIWWSSRGYSRVGCSDIDLSGSLIALKMSEKADFFLKVNIVCILFTNSSISIP